MNIIQSDQAIKHLTSAEKKAGVNVMKQCFAVKQNENILIVTDKGLLNEAMIFFESAKLFTKNVTLVEMNQATEHAQEPPQKIAEMMIQYNISLLVTSYSLSHTQARLNACRKGARIGSLPMITHDIILRTLTSDHHEIAMLSEKLAHRLTVGKNIVLTSRNGTNISFDLLGRTAIADTGFLKHPGDFGNLPAGEAFIAPIEGKSEGIIIFDGCFADITLDQPITVKVKNGKVVDIAGGEASRLLNERLARAGHNAYNIAEFGMGTNKKARLGNNLLEVEKVYGTCHIALGNNITFGGEVDVPFHSDGVILKPTIKIDGTLIMKEGVYFI